jgi:hypothetical protein
MITVWIWSRKQRRQQQGKHWGETDATDALAIAQMDAAISWLCGQGAAEGQRTSRKIAQKMTVK